MKLYYSSTSPYSRKVRMMILTRGLEEKIEGVLLNPFNDINEFVQYNPLGKIPTLVLDNGEALYDSPVICQYLDSLSDQNVASNNEWLYWENLRWEALADGLIDAAYNIVMERRRVKTEQSLSCIDQWTIEISRALEQIESQFIAPESKATLSQISIAAALGYLEFRLPQLLSKTQYIGIFKWYRDYKSLDFMVATQLEG